MDKERATQSQAADKRLELFQKKQEAIAARANKVDDEHIRTAELRFKTLSAKKAGQAASTNTKQHKAELQKARQFNLEDLVGVDDVESPTAVNTKVRMEESETEAMEESSETDHKETDDLATAGAVRAIDCGGEEAPPLKSAFKTPSPKKKSLLSSLFRNTQKKKTRVSFGANQTATYTPPNSDETRRMHGVEIRKYDVVVTDLPVYKKWRRYHDAEFVNMFNTYHVSLMENSNCAKQILHAARIMEVLKEVDVLNFREVAKTYSPVTNALFPKPYKSF
eukprot:scaffold4554_cov178-Amphora_coffeaeformis.AAC.11